MAHKYIVLPIETEVSNINGSSDRSPKCKCGDWSKHWLKFSGREKLPDECCIVGCKKPVEDGAHINVQGEGKKWFIAMMCHDCNMKTDEYLRKNNLPPLRAESKTICVLANRSETCDDASSWENIKETIGNIKY